MIKFEDIKVGDMFYDKEEHDYNIVTGFDVISGEVKVRYTKNINTLINNPSDCDKAKLSKSYITNYLSPFSSSPIYIKLLKAIRA